MIYSDHLHNILIFKIDLRELVEKVLILRTYLPTEILFKSCDFHELWISIGENKLIYYRE